ncbi:hypothetical protein [Rubritalea tangerina]
MKISSQLPTSCYQTKKREPFSKLPLYCVCRFAYIASRWLKKPRRISPHM